MNPRRLFSLILICLSLSIPVQHSATAASTFDVCQYGAVGDGVSKDTKAIRAAIDDAARQGGGTILFPPGRYLTGTLDLYDHITLHLQAGATILGSKDLADYPKRIPAFRSYTDNYVQYALIYAEKATNISIEGRGTIDGQGGEFVTREYLIRPYVIRMVECSNVTVEDVTLRNSPMWMQHYLACDGVKIHGIRVENLCNYNNDGLDLDSCRNVVVSDCVIYSDDDAICLKSTSPRMCENITISNCVIGSHCNALKMGTETNGGFNNIAISNCTISPPPKSDWSKNTIGISGIALEIVDGGAMDQIVIDNITMRGVKSPLFIRLGNRARPHKANAKTPDIGKMKNISISRVIANDVSNYGCVISGLPNHRIENISLSDIQFHFPKSDAKPKPLGAVPELEDRYPEATMFGPTPSYGLFARHVDGIRMNGLRFSFDEQETRPALALDDAHNVQLFDCMFEPSRFGSLIHLRNSREVFVHGCTTMPNTNAFISCEGDVEEFNLIGNNFQNAKQVVDSVNQKTDIDLSGNRLPPND